MKVSEITENEIAKYLRLGTDDYIEGELDILIKAAKAFIASYTGLDAETMDTHDDFVIVVYILCSDMYDNRSLYVDKNNLNKVVDTILGMYCTNLLPTPE